VTPDQLSGNALDIATLEQLAQAANTHPLAIESTLQPDPISPEYLELSLDDNRYPDSNIRSHLEIRWFEGSYYSIRYIERWGEYRCQCRWDRHPVSEGPMAHFHPLPNMSLDIESSPFEQVCHIPVVFSVLDWISERIKNLSN
jgi:hypothetical protein